MYVLGTSQINNNNAKLGGGIYSEKGSVRIISELTFMPQIRANTAQLSGGGLWLGGDGEFQIFGALIQNNRVDNTGGSASASGGGITFVQENLPRDLTIYDSVLSGNQAVKGNGGAISVGGGYAHLFINNSTISDNQSTQDGGGIRATRGTVLSPASLILTGRSSSPVTTPVRGMIRVNLCSAQRFYWRRIFSIALPFASSSISLSR